MSVDKFENNIRNITEDVSVDRVEVTTIPMTKSQAVAVSKALDCLDDISIEIIKDGNNKQILKFEVLG